MFTQESEIMCSRQSDANIVVKLTLGVNLLCVSTCTSLGRLSTVVLVRPRLPRLALVDQLGRVRHPRAKRFPLGVL